MTQATLGTTGPGNLPVEPNSFVGRERDLADLALVLAQTRLLTLSGPGGIGKTRLAVRLAGQVASAFPGGAWVAELADVQDPALLPVTVAAALGVRQEPDRPLAQTLADALMPQRLLLVLDTCEHLVEPVAEFARELLGSCYSLSILATSREPLRLSGETVWRVPPLELPSDPAGESLPAELASHEAIRLFCDRAIAVRPGFELKPDNARAVRRVCQVLDGVPLAIELAAARLRVLSVEQLAVRLGDSFELLASGDRTAPLRQQTLRATVEWSHDLLTEAEQVLLRRLAVFSGFSLEAAERVCAGPPVQTETVLSLLAALIDKSLVALDGDVGGVVRYRMLDTIREYARGQLAVSGEMTAVELRHLTYMLHLAQDMAQRSFRRGELAWPEQVDTFRTQVAELPNYRAALGTALQHGLAEQGLQICCLLRAPWVVHGNVAEGATWFDRFLLLGQTGPALRARALALRAELAFEQQDYAKAEDAARQAIELCTAAAVPGSAGGHRLLGLIELRAGRAEQALASVESARAAAQAEGDEWEEGLALTASARIQARAGRRDEAQRDLEQALEVLADNNGWGVAHVLSGLGGLAVVRGDTDAALAYFHSALAMFREIDARPEMARCLAGIGRVELATGNLDSAAASLRESLALSVATGQRLGIARGLRAVGALAAARGDLAAAARLDGEAARLLGQPAQPTADTQPTTAGEAVALALAVCAAGGPASQSGGAEAGGDPRKNGRSPALTAREHEIALLIARGLSNRAIADELVISPATAARHVANILGKLGFSSRAQVAAWTAGQTAGHDA